MPQRLNNSHSNGAFELFHIYRGGGVFFNKLMLGKCFYYFLQKRRLYSWEEVCNFIAYLRNCFGLVDIVLLGKLNHWIDLNNSNNPLILHQSYSSFNGNKCCKRCCDLMAHRIPFDNVQMYLRSSLYQEYIYLNLLSSTLYRNKSNNFLLIFWIFLPKIK